MLKMEKYDREGSKVSEIAVNFTELTRSSNTIEGELESECFKKYLEGKSVDRMDDDE